MGGPKCENNYCEVPGRTIFYRVHDGVGGPDEDPKKRVTAPPKLIRRNEVTVGEMRAHLAKHPGVDLSVVLSGCGSLKPEQIVVKSKSGEDQEALLKRARQFAALGSCNVNDLKVDRHPKQGMQMEGSCGEMNKRGDDHPYVCADQKEAVDFCASEGGGLASEVDIENASRGASGEDEYGTSIAKAVLYANQKDGKRGTQAVCGPNNERANDLGICDLTGNAWERTSTRLTGKPDETVVFRGGAFNVVLPMHRREALRGSVGTGDRRSDVGFRCARPLP